jgi:hypothetical protein
MNFQVFWNIPEGLNPAVGAALFQDRFSRNWYLYTNAVKK